MPVVIIKLEEGERRIPFIPGQSLRNILDMTDIRVRSGCRGIGACGLCRVRIIEGEVGKPTLNEHTHLDNAQLAQGIRLACQVTPEQDLQIVILELAPKSNWRRLPGRERWSIKRHPAFTLRNSSRKVKHSYGVAVDLGTTHISLSLYELSNCEYLAGCYGLNSQMNFGSDVITRLMAASESQEQAQSISQQAIETIGDALLDIATREGINLHYVVHLVLVGNTAMLALLSGRNYKLLLQPSHWMRVIDCLPENTEAWVASWGLYPQAKIEVIPPLSGFVGSDLLAGVVATHLDKNRTGSLFIDFGTNSEIALWDGQNLWVTSAAGGPAFEGCGISCGIPAEPGAIYRVNLKNGTLDFDVIAGGKAQGVCGSGLVDLIAGLVKSGRLTKRGRFVSEVSKEGFVLIEGKQSVVLTKRDVDIFQRAKAAVGVGIKVLLAKTGMNFKDLQRVCVGGAFGHSLNVANAQDIGLLPKIHSNLVELCENTALTGCEEFLLSSTATEYLKSLREQVKIINLSQYHDFDDLFFENLYLEPMR